MGLIWLYHRLANAKPLLSRGYTLVKKSQAARRLHGGALFKQSDNGIVWRPCPIICFVFRPIINAFGILQLSEISNLFYA